MKPTIKINYASFWPVFDRYDNYFTKILSRDYIVELSDDPDFLIFSVYNHDFMKYKCIRIFYTAENVRPNFNLCDFAFSFDHIEGDSRHYRLPHYQFFGDPLELLKPQPDPKQILKEKTRFCNMVVSNPFCRERIKFFHMLSKYKQVDSGGKILNNIGGPVLDKKQFIKDHKFTLAFENSSFPGYTTEKIFEPMLVNSIPIYWGNPLIGRDFNTKSFINLHDFNSFEDAIEYIIEVDNNDDLYMNILQEPRFIKNKISPYINEENILRQFSYIFSHKKKITPVASTSRGRYHDALKVVKAHYKDAKWLILDNVDIVKSRVKELVLK